MESTKSFLDFYKKQENLQSEHLDNLSPLEYLKKAAKYLNQFDFPFVDENHIEAGVGAFVITNPFSKEAREINHQFRNYLFDLGKALDIEINSTNLTCIYEHICSTTFNKIDALEDFESRYYKDEHKESFLLFEDDNFIKLNQVWGENYKSNFNSEVIWKNQLLSGNYYWHKFYFLGYKNEVKKVIPKTELKTDLLDFYFTWLGKNYANVYSKLSNYISQIDNETVVKLKEEISNFDVKGKTKERLLLAYKLGIIQKLKEAIDPNSTTFASSKTNQLVAFLFGISKDSAKLYNMYFGNPKKDYKLANDPRKEDVYHSLADVMEELGFKEFEKQYKFNPNE